jgi:hypothetical protein
LDTFEALGGFGPAGVVIGMKLLGKAPIGLLDLSLRRNSVNSKNLIRIWVEHVYRISSSFKHQT